jgi:hypothetical protein
MPEAEQTAWFLGRKNPKDNTQSGLVGFQTSESKPFNFNNNLLSTRYALSSLRIPP